MPGPMRGGHGEHAFAKPKNTKATFGRIMKYMGSNKLLLFFVFLMLILSTACSILASYQLRPIIDDYIYPVFDRSGLIKQLALLSALYFGAALFNFLQSRIMVSVAYKTTNKIRKELFNHLQGLPLRYFDSKTHGEIMSRFTNDIDNVQNMLEQSIVQLLSSCFTFIGLIAAMLVLSPQLFLVSLVFLVIIVLASLFLSKKTRKHFRAQQARLGEMNGTIEESIEGMKVVKAFNHEKQVIAQFEENNSKFRKSATNANFYAGAIGPTMNGLNNVCYGAIAVIGGLLAISGHITPGTLFTFLSYSKQFSQPINQITNQMNNIFSALAGAERVFEIMDMDYEVDEGTVTLEETVENGKRTWNWIDGDKRIPVKGAVVFTDVTFSYVPEKVVLKNISLYAKEGQKIAFVGSTGAGKTTITNLINRFYDIQEGTITYDGIDIKRIKKDDLRRSMALVLQDTHLFTGTVMDNIRYGRLDATDEECIAAAKLASAHSFIRRLPDGYQTKLTGDGDNLSQGQRQLLAIARAAVANPPVMILDEATSSIDTRTEMHIEHGMDRLMADKTTFVIAHRLSTVRNSNAIMVLEHGEIIERGSHDDLLLQKGRYYELCTGKANLS